ncbi:MAG TPA: putative metal-binding motif-containing protein, partial [Candidatus Polarisedimenticolia bacterium]|nr:putative metal-binding motif-containing protein [Candidatus Polarisedimenticolia bacterium]
FAGGLGGRLLVWGGNICNASGSNCVPVPGGRSYDPVADTWSPISTVNAPLTPGQSITSAGDFLFVWGGATFNTSFNTGAYYQQASDTWSLTSPTDAPSGRGLHTAIWDGREVIIWGGRPYIYGGTPFETGGRYRITIPPGELLDADIDGWRVCDGDCNDGNAAIHPGAQQICDGLNDDCNDVSWPAVPADEADADGDGVRVCSGDCDDASPARFPGNPETCDGLDNNCDLILPATESDADGDGVRICSGDCDDSNPARYPGHAETCDNIDNDCDDNVDGFPTACGLGQCASTGYCSAGVNSCVTGIPTPEICDGIDNDCDGDAGETDSDSDGLRGCEGDCDDTVQATHPGAVEINDAHDNQCPGDPGYGLTDEIAPDSGFPNAGDTSLFCWSAQPSATGYRVTRSSAKDFSTACASGNTSLTCWSDPATPPIGQAFNYLVRATTPNPGSWGARSNGAERAVSCGVEVNCTDGLDDEGDGASDCADSDCQAASSCSHVFAFVDTNGNDISDSALYDFFLSLPVSQSDFIMFDLAGTSSAGAWCAQRADAYVNAYLSSVNMGVEYFESGAWNKWHRPEGGAWVGAGTATFSNTFGESCLGLLHGSYSWCSEQGLGGRYLSIGPGFTNNCEAQSSGGCGTGSTVLTITVGPSRVATCGF